MRMWLTGLSEKLLYYGNIFDTLAQHHPEYVALAWGTLKFLFVVSALTPIYESFEFLYLHVRFH